MGKLKPILKWAGGKRQLLPEIKKRMPKTFNWYFEPFLGGGALLFELRPEKAIINDANLELINLYRVIRGDSDELLTELKSGQYENTSDAFYKIRAWDREKNWINCPDVKKAARMLYLNKTCYNGLYRLNEDGQFNAPFGKYKNGPKWEPETIKAISYYLLQPYITILYADFTEAVKMANWGDFVYFDPPYEPLTETADFTSYTAGGFNRTDQIRLHETFVKLTNKGVKCMLSNSNVPFIMNLYRDFKIEQIQARRNINSNATKRGLALCDVIITNYEVNQ